MSKIDSQKLSNLSQQWNLKDIESGHGISMMNIPIKNEPVLVSEINKQTVFNCINVEAIVKAFQSGDLQDQLLNTDNVLQLNIKVQENYRALLQKELEILSENSINKSIVMSLESKDEQQQSIYWKSSKYSSFFTLKCLGDEFVGPDKSLYRYIADFLASSLSRGELGINSFTSNDNEIDINSLADSRNYNLLLIAAEDGNAEAVKSLLDMKLSPVADDEANAQDLAWINRHSEVLVILALANLPYPEGIDINQLSNNFKAFYKPTKHLHQAINAKNYEKVEEILKINKNLEFYFDLSNKSAARVAIDAKAFDIYEILLINEIFLAPHEYEQGVFDDLEYEDQRLIRELHHKHSKDLPDKHINILMTNSSISHDVPDADGKLRHIKEAYKLLSQNDKLNTILKVVAASKKFQIIYDFNRDAVNIADPTVSDNTEGVFYVMGRIYIGAKQLLDKSTKSHAIATLAHELCHYAVNLVYSNMANPYSINDNQTMQEFEEINEKCQKEAEKEEIVNLVYECYPPDMHHAELIVRPAHMIAMYLDQPEKLDENHKIFPDLFEFFDKVINEMKAAIPDIERREEQANEKKDQKISKLRKKLTSDHITQIFDGHPLNFTDPHLTYLNDLINHDWNNLAVKLRNKVLTSNFTFQGESLKFENFNSEILNSFTSEQIVDVLDGKEMIIGKMMENRTEFYVERKFIFEGQVNNLGALKHYNVYEGMDEVIYRTDKKRIFVLSSEAGAGKTVTFEQLTMRIKRKYPMKWVSYVELRNHTELFESDMTLVDVLKRILSLDLKNEFEVRMFEELFKAGDVVILWNGFDEVSRTYSKFVLNLIQNIFNSTLSIQYICTRPLYSKQIQNKLNFHPYQLIPFNINEQNEFLTKLFKTQKVDSDKIEEIVKNIQNISKKLKLYTPLMLKLISEVREDPKLIKSENFYKIYEKFVSKKVKIWQERSEFAKNLTNFLLTSGSGFDIKKIYQKYGLIQIFPKYLNVKKLEIFKIKIPKNLPFDEISRMGILYINTEFEFEFAHRTFAEFFVAQFFIENFYLLKNERKFDENLIILFDGLKYEPKICKFLMNFIDSNPNIQPFSTEISSLLMNKHKNLFINALNQGTSDIFEMFFKFFNKDHKLLTKLLKIDDNETFYTATFNPEYWPINIDPQKIKEIAKNSLNSSEFAQFLNPKNQKGKIYFGIARFKNSKVIKVHDQFSLTDFNITNIFNIFDILKPNLTKIEQIEFLKYLLIYTKTVIQMPTFESIYYENLWENNINLLSINDTKLLIGPAINGLVKAGSYLRPAKLNKLLNFILTKAESFLTNFEIFETFKKDTILHRATVFNFLLENLWKFFVQHTTFEQQKEILLKDDNFGKIRNTGSDGKIYFDFDYTNFKIFHFSLFNSIKFGGPMILVGQIYEKYFNRTEIQDIILKSNEFMIRVIRYADKDTCKQLAEYLKKIFAGNEEALMEFLMRKIEFTDLNIFDYFKGFSAKSGDANLFMIKNSIKGAVRSST